MPTSRLALTTEWDAASRITASGDTAVLMRNTNKQSGVFYAITDNDTAPTFSEYLGHVVPSGEQVGLTLLDTERLWIASQDNDFDITVTQGGV